MASSSYKKAQMVQILHFESSDDAVTPKLDCRTLKEIVLDDRCENLPFFVMSMTGCRRNGKSFLTNLLISKFEFQEKHPGLSWIDSDEVIEGVDWSRQRDSVTKGIWVWNQPIVVTTVGNQQVAVILLDCQGLYDSAPHQTTMDAMITLYSLELSKLQVFNSKGDINASDLQHLESIISLAGMSGLSRMFNTLILLHRDWERDEDYGERGSYFENTQENQQLNKTEQVVKDAFVESTECTLPTPGKNVRTADVWKEESLQEFMEDHESATFLRCVDRFGDMIVNIYTTQGRHLSSRDQLLLTIERINEHVQDGDRHYTFHSPAEIHERRQIQEIYQNVEDETLPAVAKRIQAVNYKRNQRTKMDEDVAKEKEAVKSFLEQEKVARPTCSELAMKTWREGDHKVDQWFERLAELRGLEFEGLLDKKRWQNLISGLNIACTIALCAATSGGGLAAAGKQFAFNVGPKAIAAASATGGGLGGLVAKVRNAVKGSDNTNNTGKSTNIKSQNTKKND